MQVLRTIVRILVWGDQLEMRKLAIAAARTLERSEDWEGTYAPLADIVRAAMALRWSDETHAS
jgi:hypothetical protein